MPPANGSQVGDAKGDVNAPNYVMKCKKPTCGRFYHVACIKDYDCNRWFKHQDKFLCPQVPPPPTSHITCHPFSLTLPSPPPLLPWQHMCRECRLRPNAKLEKDNFFLQCIHCPSSLHLKCALGKPVTVLTYRSMVCDAHAHELVRSLLALCLPPST